jgi:hypothetical protein
VVIRNYERPVSGSYRSSYSGSKEKEADKEWDAFIANFVHDEIDVECAYEHRYIVAAEVQRIIWECMRWAGVVDIPVDDPDAAPCHEDLARSACDETKAKNRCGRCKMIVSSWADK